MSSASHDCICGATLRFKQDLLSEDGMTGTKWFCRQCRTPVPGIVAEKLRHQHPS